MVSYHTPAVKKQSKQWLEKGKSPHQPDETDDFCIPSIARVRSTCTLPSGAIISANYMMMVLGKYMQSLWKKRPEMVQGDRFFHGDNAHAHTAALP
jgi:hypothetical protein